MTRPPLLLVALLGCAGAHCVAQTPSRAAPILDPRTSGTAALLQAVSAPSARVVWVSGHVAAVLCSPDGGATWVTLTVPGAAADSLQFRDVFAVDADTAYLLAAGPGARSRIYKTIDGGRTWTRQFTNADSTAFYDCFAFWDGARGIAFSDAVAGHFIVRRTTDGGTHWDPIPDDALPAARQGEGSFAASGTCVLALGDRFAWIGTGAADTARVLRSTDGGRRWSVAATPVPGGPTAGLAALVFSDSLHGVALGGDVADPDRRSANVAVTSDGGVTWRAATAPPFSGAVYGAAAVPGRPGALVAVGPRGMAYSADAGNTWVGLDTLAYWSVGFGSAKTGWAVGPKGRITGIRLP
jgi:photosystem II stability/assembly factor-like uncharacterized protein